jgi:Acetoacetate decarboxylase (ADC)
MLVGRANPDALAHGVATMSEFATEAARFENVETLQLFCEVASQGIESLLPPALHPTIPAAVTWLVQRFPASPWGPFALAQCRIECRSGLRPRGFLRAAVVDQERAATGLTARWGYTTLHGEVDLRRSYDVVRAQVRSGGREILDIELRSPEPLRGQDVYYVANMNLAYTPRGLRLVQVDPDFDVERAERGKPLVNSFDAAAWKSEGVRPSHPVSASFTVATVTLPPVRFVCRPEVLAFEGTERVGS